MATEIDLTTIEKLPASVADALYDIVNRCDVALQYIERRRAHEQQEAKKERERIASLPWYKRMFTSYPYIGTYGFWHEDSIANLQLTCKLQKDFPAYEFHRLREVERDMKELPL